MAGFEVATYGRFWVATEAIEPRIDSPAGPLNTERLFIIEKSVGDLYIDCALQFSFQC
jgi:hypothetical protein